MATRTAQTAASGGQVFSNPLAWTSLSVPAVDGSDNLIIPAGVTMLFDTSGIWGSNVSNVGPGLAVRATNSTTFGDVVINPGVTCEFRGMDWGTTTEANQAVFLAAYAKFRPQGGSTVMIGNASNWQSGIAGRGRIIVENASLANPARFTSPASSYSWNTTATLSASNTGPYKTSALVRVSALGSAAQQMLSNAAGTALGSMGDSSVSITGGAGATAASVCIVTPVASPELVLVAGDYYIDHELGYVYYISTASTVPAWTVTGKRLAITAGWGIDLTHNVNGSEGQFDGAEFTYMGDMTSGQLRFVLNVANKTSPGAGGTDRRFWLKNSRMRFTGRQLCLSGASLGGSGSVSGGSVVGSAGDPILIEDNELYPCYTDATGAGLIVYRQNVSHLHIKRNTIRQRTFAIFLTDGTTARELRSWVVSDNSGICDTFLATSYTNDSSLYWNKGITMPNSIVERNTFTGSRAADSVWIQGICGKAGEPFTVRNNSVRRINRIANLCSYTRYHGNKYNGSFHHGYMGGASALTHYITDVRVYNEIADVPGSDTAPFYQQGYNNFVWTDDIHFVNNTVSSAGLIEMGDSTDNSGCSLVTNLIVANNANVRASRSASQFGIKRGADTSTWRGRSVPTRLANNLIFGATAQYSGLSHQAVPMRAGVAYNEDGTRGILGVVLWDPSYASPPAAKSLVYTYTSETDRTIAWDGGTPQQVVADNGTATGLSTTTLSDSSKAWSTALNNANCPRARWLVITSGSNAGQVRAILGNTGTQLTFMPPLAAVVDTTPTYVILHSELQLVGADAATVRVGIDARTLPTSSQTDTGITFDYQEPTTDPAFPIGASAVNEDLSTIVGDFTPPVGSSARDAGVTGSWAPSDDIIGTLRPQGAALDIGAVEGIVASGDHIRQQIPRPVQTVTVPRGNLRLPRR